MSGPVLHHRTPEFLQILQQTWANLKIVFQTKQMVQILTGTGSAAMEAAVVNSASQGEPVLVVVSGKFGERWADMCERFSLTTTRWEVPWGEALDLSAFATQLKENPRTKVVFTQACETSTGTLHPIEAMAKLVRDILPDALFAVDAITAVGCTKLQMDDWGIDIVIAGSQKAFMIPTGLSFIALSERAWSRQSKSVTQKYYFDLQAEKNANSKGDSQFSIPTPLVTGLNLVLQRLKAPGGLRQLQQRCQILAETTREVGTALGMPAYSKSPSPSVTALSTSSDSSTIRDWLEGSRNITLMGGQDRLKGKILRVGHMGDVQDDDMLALFSSLSEHANQIERWLKLKAEVEAKLKSAPPLFAQEVSTP